jgi:ankyrin repeat protein
MIEPGQFAEAVWAGDIAGVEAMIAAGIDVNAPSENGRQPPLHLAIEQQRPEIVRRLIAAGAEVNGDLGRAWTPLAHAIDIESDAASQAGRSPDEVSTELVELLLAAGALPTERAFELAESYGNHKVLSLLRRAKEADSL